jgi:hypothetical protein
VLLSFRLVMRRAHSLVEISSPSRARIAGRSRYRSREFRFHSKLRERWTPRNLAA